MTNLPSSTELKSVPNVASAKTVFGNLADAVKEMPGGAAPSTLVIAAGSITPTVACHLVDTEAATSSDDLTNIQTTNHTEGRILLLSMVDAARVVTIKHNAGGAGQVSLANGYDLVLKVGGWVQLKCTGANWEEVSRSQNLVSTVRLSGPIDESFATVASAATSSDIWSAKGNVINFTGTVTVTAFPSAPQAGVRRRLVCAGACSFTAGSNMVIDGVASGNTLTVAADDIVDVDAVSTTKFKLHHIPVSGTARNSDNLAGLTDKAAARTNLGLGSAARTNLGKVLMVRTADSGNNPSANPATWVVYKPDGSVLDVTGTTSQGLQEAINYACRYGYDLEVLGGAVKPQVFGVDYGGALGANPFATTNGSSTVTVTHASHPFTTGMKVTFNGLSGAVNGIPASEFAAERVLTVVNANSYTIALSTNATSTGTGGGSAVRYQQSGQDPAIINCSTGITVPPLQLAKLDIHATINFGGSYGGPAILFDSVMASEIYIRGQIVCSSTYLAGVRIKPTKELPQDPFGPIFGTNTIKLPSIVMGGAATCVDFDASLGTIAENFVEIMEPNNTSAGGNGVQARAGASTVFAHNFVRIVDAHGCTTGLNVGVSTTYAANIYGNTWQASLNCKTGGVGAEVFGAGDLYILSITNLEGTPTNGITLNTSAKKNIINVMRNDATNVVNDASTEKSNNIILPTDFVEANLGGTAQTGVASATWTKIIFGNEVIDTAGAYDNTVGRYTAKYPGQYQISASIGWVSLSAAGMHALAIYKNGASIKERYGYSPGGGSSDGLILSYPINLAAGDYIEIFALQSTGISRDVAGNAALSTLNIKRL